MRAAQIEGGLVVNVLEVDDLADVPGGVATETGNVGDGWDGGKFTPPAPTKEALKAAALARLEEIDAKSIRAIREYIVSKADAPALLKAREAEAAAERMKLAG